MSQVCEYATGPRRPTYDGDRQRLDEELALAHALVVLHFHVTGIPRRYPSSWKAVHREAVVFSSVPTTSARVALAPHPNDAAKQTKHVMGTLLLGKSGDGFVSFGTNASGKRLFP